MTTHEVQLQLQQVVFIDTYVRQLAEAGVYTVDRATFGDDILNHGARTFDTYSRVIREHDLFPAFSNVDDLLESELLTVELKHDHCRLPIADFRFNEMQLKSTE